jgi:hypothetical protein
VVEKHDWSHDEQDAPGYDVEWDKIDKEVGGYTYDLLDVLSQDTAQLEADVHGWTEIDRRGLELTFQVDWGSRILVPPAATSARMRMEFMETMATWRASLPFSEAERKWLLDDSGDGKGMRDYEPAWLDEVRTNEREVISAGLIRVISGRDLLQRWWSWRRQVGEYAGQASLDQACEALADLTGMLTPELGLPQNYLERQKFTEQGK